MTGDVRGELVRQYHDMLDKADAAVDRGDFAEADHWIAQADEFEQRNLVQRELGATEEEPQRTTGIKNVVPGEEHAGQSNSTTDTDIRQMPGNQHRYSTKDLARYFSLREKAEEAVKNRDNAAAQKWLAKASKMKWMFQEELEPQVECRQKNIETLTDAISDINNGTIADTEIKVEVHDSHAETEAIPSTSSKKRRTMNPIIKNKIERFVLWPLWVVGIGILINELCDKHGIEFDELFIISGGCLAISFIGNVLHEKVDWKENKWLLSVAALFVVIYAGTVWPTAYHYDHTHIRGKNCLVRINRFSGQVEFYDPDGWWRKHIRD